MIRQGLVVHPDAKALGVQHPIAAIIDSVQVRATEKTDDRLLDELPQSIEEVRHRPEILGFRQLFARMGYPGQIPAGERLLERILAKGFPFYNNVVDAYNLVSARYCVGIGMHDAAVLGSGDDVHVFRGRGHELIVPMFKTDATTVPSGDLVYGSTLPDDPDPRLLAWLGKRDVDADSFKVSENTRTLLLVVLGNDATDEMFNLNVCEEVFRLLKASSPDATLHLLPTVDA